MAPFTPIRVEESLDETLNGTFGPTKDGRTKEFGFIVTGAVCPFAVTVPVAGVGFPLSAK